MTLNNNRPPCREIGLRGVLLIALCVVVVNAAFGLGVRAAGAHGNPEVRIEPNPVAFEGEVTIEGEGFEEETAVSLVLEGVLGETSLGTASTDPEGAFVFTVTLPSTAAPGGYRIRAVGPEDVAIADVRIQEAEGGAAPPLSPETELGFHRGGNTAEIVGLSALAGAMVLVALFILWFPWREPRA